MFGDVELGRLKVSYRTRSQRAYQSAGLRFCHPGSQIDWQTQHCSSQKLFDCWTLLAADAHGSIVVHIWQSGYVDLESKRVGIGSIHRRWPQPDDLPAMWTDGYNRRKAWKAGIFAVRGFARHNTCP